MKYWRGYLVAIIFFAISGALTIFAKAHVDLIDMVYPYMSKSIVSSLADWSAGASFCLWNVIVLSMVVLLLLSIILMIILRWNPIQLGGWILACVAFFSLLSTVVFGLNKYTGRLADDIRIDVTEYTVTELNEAATYFQEQANALADKVKRKGGDPDYGSFDAMAKSAGEGFKVLTYQEAMSVFSGSTAPVKKDNLSSGLSKTLPLTGECVVDPDSNDLVMPFIMCKEMARRMSIYHEEDAEFAAFLACKANPDVNFQYTAYCIAYTMCYNALQQNPTSTAKTCVKALDSTTGKLLKNDMAICVTSLSSVLKGSKSTDSTDLVTCWYIQNFITPLYVEEEVPFDPLDPSQVDIKYEAPTPTPLPEKKDD